MSTNETGDLTINLNIGDKIGSSDSSKEGRLILPWQSANKDTLTKEEIAEQLERGKLVNLNDNGGGVVQARLLCTPQGSGKYYSDTRDANGKLQIGKEVASPYYIGTNKPD